MSGDHICGKSASKCGRGGIAGASSSEFSHTNNRKNAYKKRDFDWNTIMKDDTFERHVTEHLKGRLPNFKDVNNSFQFSQERWMSGNMEGSRCLTGFKLSRE